MDRMNVYSFPDQKYADIVKTYLDTLSIKETADKLHTSEVKVRKVLITENLWSSRTSLMVEHYLKEGKSTAQIAELLSTTEKAVQQYLPYTRGMYNGDERSVAALNSADYRLRIHVLQGKINKRRKEIAVENEWRERSEDASDDGNEMMYTVGMQDIKKKIESGEMVLLEEENYPGALRLPESVDRSKLPGFDVIRLHLELMRDYDEEETTNVLREYGKVEHGDTISRDILVPSTLPLWALNYAIQKCFGWQNSHLHQFQLPEEQFVKITDGKVGKYAELVGVVFRSPWMDEAEEFWQDDYESGSFKTWIRQKYTGPFIEIPHGEGIWQCKEDLKSWRKRYEYVEVEHRIRGEGDSVMEFYNWPKPICKEEYESKMPEAGGDAGTDWQIVEEYGTRYKVRKEVYTFEDIPIDAARYMSERSCMQLLERLRIEEVMALRDRGMDDDLFEGDFVPECFDDVMDEDLQYDIDDCLQYDSPAKQPFVGALTDKLYYNYDFGDNWHVEITGSFGAADLVEAGRLTQEELEEAVATVHTKYRPVCIAQDGYPVLDDVGGMGGFVKFLKGINQPTRRRRKDDGADEYAEEEYSEEYGLYADKQGSLEWAKSLGWSRRRVSNKNLL